MHYRGPNGILEDVLERARSLLSLFQSSDSEDQPVTHGMLYNFDVLNSLVTGHLGKRIINPEWWNQFWWNMWCWIGDMRGYLSEKFQTHRGNNYGDMIEIVTGISADAKSSDLKDWDFQNPSTLVNSPHSSTSHSKVSFSFHKISIFCDFMTRWPQALSLRTSYKA